MSKVSKDDKLNITDVKEQIKSLEEMEKLAAGCELVGITRILKNPQGNLRILLEPLMSDGTVDDLFQMMKAVQLAMIEGFVQLSKQLGISQADLDLMMDQPDANDHLWEQLRQRAKEVHVSSVSTENIQKLKEMYGKPATVTIAEVAAENQSVTFGMAGYKATVSGGKGDDPLPN